ncbi:ABC transporter permease [Devosia albogilva]|uniref:ABC transporter permease n=1 Tax=Devosia albogilva TaxID=429726 RepID=A0ABW5QP89_9HYPH
MTVHAFIDEQPETGPAITPLKVEGRRTTDTGSAGQWQLIWQKFSRNKVAVFSGWVILFFFFIGIFAEFLAPSVPDASRPQFTNAPPQQLGFFVTEEDGSRRFQLHVTGYAMEVDPASLRRTYVPDPEQHVPVGLFVRGAPYKMWGLFNADLHLLGPLNPSDTMYLLGTDRLGRDLLTRLIYGTRISMSIGVVGVCISLLLGVVLGAISGFYGGIVDTLTQRVIEVISSMPTIPLWLGLAAAIPLSWSPLTVYFVITLIVSLFGWTGLAREVRGRFFALRGEDFVTAAKLDGSSERRVIFRHILPSLTSHILAVVTLALPTMIVAETALSFLGIGLKAPIVSWGVLLQEAQNVRTIANAPWQLIWPAGTVVVTVLAYNFLGDGMRDAADPYES